ncbi:hypothetical protein ACEWY4_017213 [Coilia grayii]|uniref:Uncharacterized protein n=1 Tax=Coilia grayii TaxID=363190 RepID=A0ABD1JHA3_9TELE
MQMAQRPVRRLPMTRKALAEASEVASVCNQSSPPVTEASQSVPMSCHRTATLREQLVEREQHVARLQEALKREREKCGRLQSRCNQQVAELRRRELQNNRLKERLLSDRQKDKGPVMEMLNVLPKPLAKKGDHAPRGPRSDMRKEEEALRVILERREAELREAMKLRHAITTLLHTLRTDMEQVAITTLLHTLRTHMEQLAITTLLHKLRTHMEQTLQVILNDQQEEEEPDSQRLIQSEVVLGDHVTGGVVKEWIRGQHRGDGSGEVIMQLEKELEESRQLVKAQQQLLQRDCGSQLLLLLLCALNSSPSSSSSSALQDSVTAALNSSSALQDSDSVTAALPAPLLDWLLPGGVGAATGAEGGAGQAEAEFREGEAGVHGRRHPIRSRVEQQKACLVRQQYLFNSPPIKLSRFNRRGSPAISDPGLNSPDSLGLATPSSTGSDQSPGSPGHGEVTTPSTPELYAALKLPYPRRSVGTPSPTECWGRRGPTPYRPNHDYSF